ncbi:Uncharacterised protein [Vibrio cholerae]|nr:Uncharacterised protein [Vibrio cholerae]
MPCAVAAHLMAKRAYALTKAGVGRFNSPWYGWEFKSLHLY